jgi:hypothetical protein
VIGLVQHGRALLSKRHIEIPNQIRRILKPNRKPYHIRPGASGQALFLSQLPMRG